MKIVTAAEMREIERRAAAGGLPSALLMENAGRAVATEMEREAGSLAGAKVLVLVGPGNNGGDGLVAACYLHAAGAAVTLYIWHRGLEGDTNFLRTQERRIPYATAETDPQREALRQHLTAADYILDAMLGTGGSRPIVGELRDVLRAVAREKRPGTRVVSLDLPSGLNADTGVVDESCLAADLTITLGCPKVGLFLFPGAERVGKLVVSDIGIPESYTADVSLEMVAAEEVERELPSRPLNSHKGTFGKVLIVAGSTSYVGAPYLAAAGAARVGAGLVTLALARTLHPILAAKLTEATFLALPEAESGVLGLEAVEPLLEAAPGYDVLLLGPGLGRHGATARLVEALIRAEKSAMPRSWVVDADGLNLLAGIPDWWRFLPEETVLTPHPGELARLIGATRDDVQGDRLGTARGAAQQWQKVVVLKGANTIIAAPSGQASIVPSANPALASAGTGDVLAGAIAGLLAQGLDPYPAAMAGVYLHAAAGARLRRKLGDAGVLASDLLPLLPRVLRDTRKAGKPA